MESPLPHQPRYARLVPQGVLRHSTVGAPRLGLRARVPLPPPPHHVRVLSHGISGTLDRRRSAPRSSGTSSPAPPPITSGCCLTASQVSTVGAPRLGLRARVPLPPPPHHVRVLVPQASGIRLSALRRLGYSPTPPSAPTYGGFNVSGNGQLVKPLVKGLSSPRHFRQATLPALISRCRSPLTSIICRAIGG